MPVGPKSAHHGAREPGGEGAGAASGLAVVAGRAGKTVETHVRSIFQKLDLEENPDDNRRVQAVVRWLQPPG